MFSTLICQWYTENALHILEQMYIAYVPTWSIYIVEHGSNYTPVYAYKSTSVVDNKIRNCEEEWRCGRLPQTKTKTVVWVAGYFVDRTRGGLQPCVAGLPYKGWMSVMLLGGQKLTLKWGEWVREKNRSNSQIRGYGYTSELFSS